MKKYILPESGKFYKANLHSHSTCSDGKKTPEQLKAMYIEKGYSVFAYTDHNMIIDHSDLTDENFIALTSAEYNFELPCGYKTNDPCYHVNFFSEDPHFDFRKFEQTEPERFAAGKSFGQHGWSHGYGYARVNEAIAEAASYGFLVALNHPKWSEQTFADYKDLDGLFAMEIYNNCSYVQGHFEINTNVYDMFLREGKKLFVLATDDNHNLDPVVTAITDSFGGFVMIKADELKYDKIIGALRRGDFYASTGPEIFEYYEEDGELYVRTSPAERICFTTCGRNVKAAYPTEGDTVCEARYRIRPDDMFVRVTVYDGRGHYAWTNAYFA